MITVITGKTENNNKDIYNYDNSNSNDVDKYSKNRNKKDNNSNNNITIIFNNEQCFRVFKSTFEVLLSDVIVQNTPC